MSKRLKGKKLLEIIVGDNFLERTTCEQNGGRAA